MLCDDDTFPMAASTSTYAVDVEHLTSLGREAAEETHGRTYANDDFDDVFGSAPGSPSFEHEYEIHNGQKRALGNVEPSDVPRLKEKHETEGYREGVTRGKAESVQTGFDEGYGLGAVLGLSVGKLLGLIEGVWGAVNAAAKADGGANSEVAQKWTMERERLEKLFNEANEELKTEKIFGRDWWGEDGIWNFEVPGEGKVGEEVVFPDIAAAHPLIKKWEVIIDNEIQNWGLDLELLGTAHEHNETKALVEKKDETPTRTAPGAAKELNW